MSKSIKQFFATLRTMVSDAPPDTDVTPSKWEQQLGEAAAAKVGVILPSHLPVTSSDASAAELSKGQLAMFVACATGDVTRVTAGLAAALTLERRGWRLKLKQEREKLEKKQQRLEKKSNKGKEVEGSKIERTEEEEDGKETFSEIDPLTTANAATNSRSTATTSDVLMNNNKSKNKIHNKNKENITVTNEIDNPSTQTIDDDDDEDKVAAEDIVNINTCDVYGQSCLMKAVRGGHDTVVFMLLTWAKQCKELRMTALRALHSVMSDAEKDEAETKDSLPTDIDSPLAIDYQEPHSGMTALHIACRDGKVSSGTIARMVEGGATVNLRCLEGWLPLHWAICGGHESLSLMLLHLGASPTATTASDHSPLHIAASVGSTKLVSVLITAGADVNGTTIDGYTPLHLAAIGEHVATMEALISSGADVNALAEGEAEDESSFSSSTTSQFGLTLPPSAPVVSLTPLDVSRGKAKELLALRGGVTAAELSRRRCCIL